MKMLSQCLLGVAVACVVNGCAATDDPREGGLISYWRHGEEGYQERLERRQAELDAARIRADTVQDESVALEEQRDQARQEVAQQRAKLNELREEIREFEQVLATAPAEPQAQPEVGKIQQELAELGGRLQALDTDTTVLIQERERRIGELKKELKLLRERASLLTTL